LREKSFGRPNSFEEALFKGNLNNISGFGAHNSKRVFSVNHSASEDSLDGSHIDVCKLNLFVDQVSLPDFDSVVVDREQIRIGIVIEENLIGSVCSNWVAAESFASGNLKVK